jgi:hypothetical protein
MVAEELKGADLGRIQVDALSGQRDPAKTASPSESGQQNARGHNQLRIVVIQHWGGIQTTREGFHSLGTEACGQ